MKQENEHVLFGDHTGSQEPHLHDFLHQQENELTPIDDNIVSVLTSPDHLSRLAKMTAYLDANNLHFNNLINAVGIDPEDQQIRFRRDILPSQLNMNGIPLNGNRVTAWFSEHAIGDENTNEGTSSQRDLQKLKDYYTKKQQEALEELTGVSQQTKRGRFNFHERFRPASAPSSLFHPKK